MTELKLPDLGENITQGTVTNILVKSGDAIKKGQNILELETDKAVFKVPSSADGVVSEILIKNGAVVKVGQPIFKVEGGAAPTEKPSVIASEAKQSFKEVATSPSAPRNDTAPVTTVTLRPIPVRRDIPAAPSVRLLARELGIDLSLVPGSGRGGRISLDDVKAYCKMLNTSRPTGGAAIASQPLPNFTKWGPVRREPMNNVRKKTAERLSYAWGIIPHVTQFDKADITELEKFRKSISGAKTATTPKKISVTPFIIKVVAAALKKFPHLTPALT